MFALCLLHITDFIRRSKACVQFCAPKLCKPGPPHSCRFFRGLKVSLGCDCEILARSARVVRMNPGSVEWQPQSLARGWLWHQEKKSLSVRLGKRRRERADPIPAQALGPGVWILVTSQHLWFITWHWRIWQILLALFPFLSPPFFLLSSFSLLSF